MKRKNIRNFPQPSTCTHCVLKEGQNIANQAEQRASHTGPSIYVLWKGQVHLFPNSSDLELSLAKIRERLGIPSMYRELVALYDLRSKTLVSSSILSHQRVLYTIVILVHQARISLAEKSEIKDSTAIFKKANKHLFQYSASILPKLIRHIAIADSKQFPNGLHCNSCSTYFSKMTYLFQHQKQNSELNTTCSVCDLRLSSTCHQSKHQAMHRPKSSFQVKEPRVPEGRLSYQENLEELKHEQVSASVKIEPGSQQPLLLESQPSTEAKSKKDYICPFCQRHFKKKFSLEDHLFSHSNSKSYICEVCGKNFKRERTLKVHQKNLHADLIQQYPQLATAKRDVKPQIFKEDEQVVGFPKGTKFGQLQHLLRDRSTQQNIGGEEIGGRGSSEKTPMSSHLTPFISNIKSEGGDEYEELIKQNEGRRWIRVEFSRIVTQLDLAKRYLELEQMKKICLYQAKQKKT